MTISSGFAAGFAGCFSHEQQAMTRFLSSKHRVLCRIAGAVWFPRSAGGERFFQIADFPRLPTVMAGMMEGFPDHNHGPGAKPDENAQKQQKIYWQLPGEGQGMEAEGHRRPVGDGDDNAEGGKKAKDGEGKKAHENHTRRQQNADLNLVQSKDQGQNAD